MTRPHRSNPSLSPALRVGLAVGLVVAGGGYAATQLLGDNPDATWQSIELDVEGLDCAFWCSVKVQTAIDAMAGAHVDAVDTAIGLVTLRYDPDRVSADDVVATIEEHGFPVRAMRSP